MSDLTATVDTYLSAWTEPDEAKRTELIEQVWAPEGKLTDPPMAVEGHDGINQMFAGLQAQFPGHTFARSSGVDSHHEFFRFGWELVSPEGAVVLTGIDVGVVAADGRLARIVGFFGPLPEDAA